MHAVPHRGQWTVWSDLNPYSEPDVDLGDVDVLVEDLERQANMLVAVATHGASRQRKETEYRRRRSRLINALRARGLTYPFPWHDLGEWYGEWSATLGTWDARRMRVRELVTPTIAALQEQRSGLVISDPGGGPPTWADLDARVSGLSKELAGASNRDDLQDVGRRAREILIYTAQLIADPSVVPDEQDPRRAGDAKGWTGLFLAARAGGGSRQALRRVVRATWDLAQTVTHGDIDRVDTYAAGQATVLVVRTLQALTVGEPGQAR
jgi:hypothetical protein